jgi:hypothetical protein
MYKITVPAGSRVLMVKNISNTPEEKEILLPRCGELKIINSSYDEISYDCVYIPKISLTIKSTTSEPINKIETKQFTEQMYIDRIKEVYDKDESDIFDSIEDYVKDINKEYKMKIPEHVLKKIVKLFAIIS